MDDLTAAVPLREWYVKTECGRHFCWSATDVEHLKRQLDQRAYSPVIIEPYENYEGRMQSERIANERAAGR